MDKKLAAKSSTNLYDMSRDMGRNLSSGKEKSKRYLVGNDLYYKRCY